MKFDYTLYLVTDSTPAILGDRDLVKIVNEAIQGGVTIVQYRDKHADTKTMVEMASKLHAVTQKYQVPLLINDRVDVAKVINAEGVHLGQDDPSYRAAREILGPDKCIGISANNVEEAQEAIKAGADYLGIGAVFGTPTKTDTKSILGPVGLGDILESIQSPNVETVAIGGINQDNASRVLYQSTTQKSSLSGLAVVSAIIASPNPKETASRLSSIIKSKHNYQLLPPAALATTITTSDTVSSILSAIPSLLNHHRTASTLSHNMTNTVVQNFAANVCLATSSSPIMSLSGPEARDLALARGGLVINMGTLTPELMTNYLNATLAYNSLGNPIVFDPVGAGATALRRSAVQQLMHGSYFTLIKGNEAEINTVYTTSFKSPPSSTTTNHQRGVDSGPSTSTAAQKAHLVLSLARRERNLILMTGATDYLSNGDIVLAISNGHPYLGKITGSGCALGSVLAAFLASARVLMDKQSTKLGGATGARSGIAATKREGAVNYLSAAVAAVCVYEIAAELAVESGKVHGPGSFVPAFIDALFHVVGDEECKWISRAKVEVVEV